MEAAIKLLQKMEPCRCRVCKGELYDEPLLSYAGMPAAAQNFPDANAISEDKAHDLDVYQCTSCGLVQLTNAPVSYYKDVIRAAAFSDEMRDFRLIQLKGWVEKYSLTNRKIIEIGCGYGEYLSLLNTVGVEAYGIEHDWTSVEYCQSLGLKVSQGYMEANKIQLDAGPFDGFVCLNFMEHWPDPASSLKAIAGNLNNSAIGLVEVPNFDMILQKGLFSEFISDHLLYFTEDTLRHTLQSHGFEVLECTPVWHDYILSAVVRKRTPTSLTFFKQFRDNITSQLHDYIHRFPSGKVAVWGAGHQALAVIALGGIADKISYVIDSAPFKQGKYTPATHLPIVSPEHLNDGPMAAIIVMAAAYSDEVARLIRSSLNPDISIAILRDHGLEEID